MASARNAGAFGRSGSASVHCPPGRREDLRDHCPLFRHVFHDLPEACRDDAAAGLDHVFHQLARIAGQWIELEPGLLDHGSELPVGCDAHPVPLRQPAADRNEGLHVPARADGP
jgi:hypothetical protein